MRSLAQNVHVIAVITLIVLRLVGVVDWSWWWVLSPLWIGGILTAVMVGFVVLPFFRNKRGFPEEARDD